MKENATVKQLNTYLGVRGENDDSAPEIGSINSGERVQVISDDGYFAYVRYHIKAYPYYKEGFVHSRYLHMNGATKAAAKPAVKAKAKSANTKATSKATAAAAKSSNNAGKDETALNNATAIENWLTVQKAAWSAVGTVAGASGSSAAIMAGSGGMITTVFAFIQTWSDPNLTTGQQYGLSALEAALFIGGIAIAALTPAGISIAAGLLITLGYAAISYAIPYIATQMCYKYNGDN